LLGVLGTEGGYARLYVRRRDGGRRGVAATQAQLAVQTGLSERQVKRALAALRSAGLVATATAKGRSWIEPDGAALAWGEDTV
jgi:hypothetical protein